MDRWAMLFVALLLCGFCIAEEIDHHQSLLLNQYSFRIYYRLCRTRYKQYSCDNPAKIPILDESMKDFLSAFLSLHPTPCEALTDRFLDFVNDTIQFCHTESAVEKFLIEALWGSSCVSPELISMDESCSHVICDNIVLESYHNLCEMEAGLLGSLPAEDISCDTYHDRTLLPKSSFDVISSSPLQVGIAGDPTIDDLLKAEYVLYGAEGLGNAFWTMMHTLSLLVRDDQGIQHFRKLATSLTKGVYPCDKCRDHFYILWNEGEGEGIARVPPLHQAFPIDAVATREGAMLWVWGIHNAVNIRLHHSYNANPNLLKKFIYLTKKIWLSPEDPLRKEAVCMQRTWECIERVLAAPTHTLQHLEKTYQH